MDRDIEDPVDRYVRITRRELDGNAKGLLEWGDVADAVWDDAEADDPLAADDLDELEVTD